MRFVLLLSLALAVPALCAQERSVEELIALAKKRDPEAEYALGMRTYEGRGLPRDDTQAFRLLERAAGRGHLEALNALGYFQQHGIGTAADPVAAARNYRSAAEGGLAAAQANLGWALFEGAGVERDAGAAREWLEKAAAQGSVQGLYNLGYVLENGPARDRAAALPRYVAAAEKGLLDAQLAAGRLLLSGEAGPRDMEQARRWLGVAAERGDPRGHALLAQCYDEGGACGANLRRAAIHLRRAATAGDARSTQRLARMLDDEKVPEAGDGETLGWLLRAAAAQGDAEDQYRLGRRFEKNGARPNLAEAASWYRRAADQGHATAALALGIALEEGRGVGRNAAEAHRYYQQAARADLAEADFRLARQYDSGNGTAENSRLALDHYNRAANREHEGARARLAQMLGTDKPLGGVNDPFRGLR